MSWLQFVNVKPTIWGWWKKHVSIDLIGIGLKQWDMYCRHGKGVERLDIAILLLWECSVTYRPNPHTQTVSRGLMVRAGALGSAFSLPGFLHLITFGKQAHIPLSFLYCISQSLAAFVPPFLLHFPLFWLIYSPYIHLEKLVKVSSWIYSPILPLSFCFPPLSSPLPHAAILSFFPF